MLGKINQRPRAELIKAEMRLPMMRGAKAMQSIQQRAMQQ